MKIKHKEIKSISEIAAELNTDAYLVGGYVRDTVLGIECTDIDIMVIGDAISFAEETAKHFKKELSAVYKNFGTALLNISNLKIEFASARKESYRRDSRKPNVELSNLTDDLSRRDFTINALAVSLTGKSEIIDLFSGLDDLKSGIIRTPLDPEKTFDDDPLRMLRAVRFASKFNFSIEENTFKALAKYRDRLKDKIVSQERISNEFLQILESRVPSTGLNLLFLTGLMDIVFPEVSNLAGVEQRKDYHHKDVFYHTLEVVDNTARKTGNVWLRFAALVHDIAKPKTKRFAEGTGWTFHGHEELGARMMKKIFERMKLPFTRLEYVQKLVRLHLRPIPLASDDVTDSAIRRLAADAGEDLEDLLLLCRADITSKNPDKMKKFMNNYDRVEKKIIEVQEKDKLRNFQSPVRGEEIMEICNLNPSKTVGTIKKAIEEAILDGIIPNDYDEAKKYLFKIKDGILKGAEGRK
ncbi:MAG: HD domain-containing protein [Ignavibacteriae bacterium]|nr:HD domain-containing protein [Ignavibacteriota bacterium]